MASCLSAVFWTQGSSSGSAYTILQDTCVLVPFLVLTWPISNTCICCQRWEGGSVCCSTCRLFCLTYPLYLSSFPICFLTSTIYEVAHTSTYVGTKASLIILVLCNTFALALLISPALSLKWALLTVCLEPDRSVTREPLNSIHDNHVSSRYDFSALRLAQLRFSLKSGRAPRYLVDISSTTSINLIYLLIDPQKVGGAIPLAFNPLLSESQFPNRNAP
ncbi:hypothetical protein K491DRAFT_33632 [Lophiostoma macrostomum CBS 122681]|uniref:Uncharacterized protein n=1 Tax=Lophiostoma macrostomum CBS 122681 TaxID=1314788 RepID=A0A6A6SYT5_9PLEO|nr:hypothetical protein K491DRAFT_33632 [Lophiostoma macrostomum CBS 122681]